MKEKFKFEKPKDNDFMTDKYKIERGGICGQACLAIIEKSSIKEVMDNWKKLNMEFKGYSGWKQLREYLKKRGFTVKLKRMDNLGEFSWKKFYLLRVQWIGEGKKKEKPFYGWGHWCEASAYTHFIVYHKGKVFCNETGWFDYHGLNKYLENAVATSAMEIYKGGKDEMSTL